VQEILLAELTSARSAAVLSPQLRARCCATLRAAGRGWHVGHASLEPLVLAFRAFVAVRMHAQLGVDAATRPARLQPAVNA